MKIIDRLGALTGLVGVPLVIAAFVLSDPAASSRNPNPDAAAELVARALAENAGSARMGAWLGIVGVFFLIAFIARLHGGLRNAMDTESWLPSVAIVGGAPLIATLLLDLGFALASSESGAYAQDSQVAKMILTWGWNSASLYAPCFAAIMAATATIAFSQHSFPTWFAWTTVGLLAVMLVMVALGVAGMATGPGLFWLMLISVVLASSGRESGSVVSTQTPHRSL